MQVVIVGAGLIGATLAFQLGQQGAQVTVIDAAGPASGATGRSFGWANASFYADDAHFRLRYESLHAYKRLAAASGGQDIRQIGCLCWEETGDAFDAQARDLTAMGYDVVQVDQTEFAQLEPHIAAPKRALYFKAEAAIEPVALTETLLAQSSARLMFGCYVSGIVVKNGAVCGVRVPGGVLAADRVIVASGTGSTAILNDVDVALPMLDRPGVILKTKPVAPILAHVLVAPGQEFRQLPDGSILAPTAANHQRDDSTDLSERLDQSADIAMERLRKLIPNVDLEWAAVSLAQRPVPQDGLPVVGACGPSGLFTSVMHSGITLAPLVAEILCAEVLDQPLSNAQADLIAPYRPDRFQS